MSDLTPEKRAELRTAALGRASLTVLANDLVALLDAADGRDRLESEANAKTPTEADRPDTLTALAGDLRTYAEMQVRAGSSWSILKPHELLILLDERDRLAGNRRDPRDLDWDRSVDSYRAAGWVDQPGDYERMFFEAGWRAAIRALDGTDG